MNRPPAEQNPGPLELGTYYTFSLLRVFAPVLLGHTRTPPSREYIEAHHQINMPPSPLAVKVGRAVVPLADRAQHTIHERAKDLLGMPYGLPPSYSNRELRLLQAYLDGTSAGMTETSIADRLGVDLHEFSSISESARDYLGVPNQASVMYNTRLHGFKPSSRPPHVEVPKLTINRSLHLYLGALGFSGVEAADLTGNTPENVKTVRTYIREKFAAQTFAQTVSNAFESGYYTPLDQ